MNWNPDLCPLTSVGNDGNSYYFHPLTNTDKTTKHDRDFRDIVQCHPSNWEDLYKWNEHQLHAVILNIQYKDPINDNFIYDHKTNILQYIINPLQRQQIIQQHNGKITTISNLSEIHKNELIIQSVKTLHQIESNLTQIKTTHNILAIIIHLTFDLKKIQLFIDKNTYNNTRNNNKFCDILLIGFISPNPDHYDLNKYQIKWTLTMSRTIWTKGNTKQWPFYQLKYQLLCFQQYFLDVFVNRSVLTGIANLFPKQNIDFNILHFYAKYMTFVWEKRIENELHSSRLLSNNTNNNNAISSEEKIESIPTAIHRKYFVLNDRLIPALKILNTSSKHDMTWQNEYRFVGIQSWHGFCRKTHDYNDVKTLTHLLNEYCSEYRAEKHPLHFLTLKEDNSNIGYKFRKRQYDEHIWFMKANIYDTYANYVRFLKEKEAEICSYLNYSQNVETEKQKYINDYNKFLDMVTVIKLIKQMNDIEINWCNRPKLWNIIESRFIAMNRLKMLEEFPLCFILQAPRTTQPWFIPIHHFDCGRRLEWEKSNSDFMMIVLSEYPIEIYTGYVVLTAEHGTIFAFGGSSAPKNTFAIMTSAAPCYILLLHKAPVCDVELQKEVLIKTDNKLQPKDFINYVKKRDIKKPKRNRTKNKHENNEMKSNEDMDIDENKNYKSILKSNNEYICNDIDEIKENLWLNEYNLLKDTFKITNFKSLINKLTEMFENNIFKTSQNKANIIFCIAFCYDKINEKKEALKWYNKRNLILISPR
eukprot:154815_1